MPIAHLLFFGLMPYETVDLVLGNTVAGEVTDEGMSEYVVPSKHPPFASLGNCPERFP